MPVNKQGRTVSTTSGFDTCCIDKSSSAELQEAINSMYRWYSEAAVCYVYLSDIDAPLVEASTSFFPGVSEHENT